MSVPVEIVKALVLPAEKLITAVQSAIGKIYEPHYIKKMAQAKAQKIELLGNAVRNNSDLSIVISDKKIKIKTRYSGVKLFCRNPFFSFLYNSI